MAGSAAPRSGQGGMFGKNIVGSILGISLETAVLSACSNRAEGLSTGNFVWRGDVFEFVVANSSEKSGDVVSWFEQNGAQYCESIFHMPANSRIVVTRSCNAPVGELDHITGWADKNRSIAAVSRRIN